MLLAGRVRKQEEVDVIQSVLEKHFKKNLYPESLFSEESVKKLLGEFPRRMTLSSCLDVTEVDWWLCVVQLNPPRRCQWWTEILTILCGLRGWGDLPFWWDEPWSSVNQYCWWETLGNHAFYDAVLRSALPATKWLCGLQRCFGLGYLSLCHRRLANAVLHSSLLREAIASLAVQVFNGIVCIMYNNNIEII